MNDRLINIHGGGGVEAGIRRGMVQEYLYPEVVRNASFEKEPELRSKG